jgi:hypothetical protein
VIGVEAEEDPAVRAELRRSGELHVDGHAPSNTTDRHLRYVGSVACVADRVLVDSGHSTTTR